MCFFFFFFVLNLSLTCHPSLYYCLDFPLSYRTFQQDTLPPLEQLIPTAKLLQRMPSFSGSFYLMWEVCDKLERKTFFWRLLQWRKTSKMQNNLLQETETVGLQTKVAEKMIIYTATGDCGSRCPSQNVTMDVRKWMCAGKVKCLLIYQRMR